MCLVGIAAGRKKKSNLGDVIFPVRIHDRSIKVALDGNMVPRTQSYDRFDTLNRIIKASKFDRDMYEKELERVLRELGVDYDVKNVEILDGSLATDNVLLRDESVLEQIASGTDEKCRGADMESGGVARACEYFDVPYAIFRGVSDYGDSNKNDSAHLLAASSSAVALKTFLVSQMNYSALADVGEWPVITESEMEFSPIKEVRNAYNNGNYERVCRLGSVLSRELWLSGQYRLRVELGKMIEICAFHSGNTSLRAKVLIDDLGWTNEILGNRMDAVKNIADGLMVAASIGDDYVASKALRHLASIDRRLGKIDDAEQKLIKAIGHLDDIDEAHKKAEMVASLKLSMAKVMIEKGDMEAAEDGARDASDMYERHGDLTRLVKADLVLAKILVRRGKKSECEPVLENCIARSIAIGRFDVSTECVYFARSNKLWDNDKIGRAVAQIRESCSSQEILSQLDPMIEPD